MEMPPSLPGHFLMSLSALLSQSRSHFGPGGHWDPFPAQCCPSESHLPAHNMGPGFPAWEDAPRTNPGTIPIERVERIFWEDGSPNGTRFSFLAGHTGSLRTWSGCRRFPCWEGLSVPNSPGSACPGFYVELYLDIKPPIRKIYPVPWQGFS